MEVANPDMVIANITSKDMKFHMDITVERGRGFAPTEERDTTGNEIGVIAVDSIFSPVLNVGLKVENTRVGEITNYDKIIMNILTDGTITAQEAAEQATKVILNHFNWLENQFKHSGLMDASIDAQESAEAAEVASQEVEEVQEDSGE